MLDEDKTCGMEQRKKEQEQLNLNLPKNSPV